MSTAETPPGDDEEDVLFDTENVDVMLACLDIMSRGPLVVGVDTTRPDVVVPPSCAGNPQLTLIFGWDEYLVVPISGLQIDVRGIRGWLRFKGVHHWCDIPWVAVWRAAGQEYRSIVWPNRLPHGYQVALVTAKPDAVVAPQVDAPDEDDMPAVGQVVRRLSLVSEPDPSANSLPREYSASAPALRVVRDDDVDRADD